MAIYNSSFLRRLIFIGLIIACVFQTAIASRQVQIYHFSDFQKNALFLGNKYGNRHVLLVFDIDNTLLTMNQTLGGDVWWNWQERLLKRHSRSKFLVAHSENELSRDEQMFFALGHMHPTEKYIPKIIQSLQRQGFKTLVLTARDPMYLNSTLRVLNENHLNFEEHSPEINLPIAGIFQSKNLCNDQTKKICFKLYQKQNDRAMSYFNGVCLDSDLNKGLMLRLLLKYSSDDIEAIVFIDDSNRNTQDMLNAFNNTKYDVIACRYAFQDYAKHHFTLAQKQAVTRQFYQFKKVVNGIFM